MEKDSNPITNVTSITSNTNRLEADAHQVDLNAVTSNVISIGAVGEALTSSQKFIILRRLNYENLNSFDDLPVGATFMIEKVQTMDEEEAISVLKDALEEFQDDPNFPMETYDLIEKLIAGESQGIKGQLNTSFKDKEEYVHDVHEKDDSSSLEHSDVNLNEVFDRNFQLRLEAALIAYWSPYPEVRAVTDCFDDPNVECETLRVYILGLIWVGIGSFVNQFFSERQPSITLGSSVVQLFLYPCGTFLAAVLPKWKFTVWGTTFDLNPGPWTSKEQMLTTLFYSVSGGSPYVSSNIHVQKMPMYYNNQWADWGYQILLMLSNNFLGFGLAGVMRKFAVYPARAVWPTLLPTLALNASLTKPEKKENINGWKISRFAFLWTVSGASFLYFWFPNYLMQFLSTFNWMTWIAPNNRPLAEVTGSLGGLGLNPFPSFDWNVLNNASLAYPFYTQVSMYIGSFLGFLSIIGIYYNNHLWTGYMPINSNNLFTNEGVTYDVKAVVNEKSLFDEKKYQLIGPPYYTAANLVVYGAFFAIYPFAFIYEVIANYKPMYFALKQLYKSFRNIRRSNFEGFNDPHSRMMSQYKEVPDWWFGIVLVISLVLAIICVKVYPAETPVWGIFFALAINFVFLIPLTSIYATTGFSFGLNVLVELIVGYAIPGNGLALNFIKAFGYNITGQAENYITDQKMAHYAKIPPRALFRNQILSVFVSSFIFLAVINFQINSIEDYCSPTQPQKFVCPGVRTFYSASITWGVIGPKKVFGGLYPILQYCFLIGALLPIPCILFKKYGPKSVAKYFQPTLIMGGFLNFAPNNLSYLTGGLYLGWAFMYYVRRRYLTWWEKYNYVLSGSLSAGVAFSSIIIFFAVQYHDKSISWWGNDVMYEGMDYYARTVGRLNATESAPDGYFGIRKGHYP
ncbi:oligopeptide transporter 2 [[Candida] jaroonii]|uniref:Oligopeptide transporter 2 n=1 Tax=[Candida] jaroonii TaxID=467808 RepID=A0ACA9YFP6_9ASCO|nr:oligopeptide transporter 2 [[Candida] jaroonii]